MTAEYTKERFIELYGHEKYTSLINYYLSDVLNCTEYKETPIGEGCYLFKVFDIYDKDNKRIGAACIEGSVIKLDDRIGDLEITSMKLTNEQLPDEFIDRYNDVSKSINDGICPL